MPLVVSLWILCAVMGLPTTLSLSCYSCQDYLGSSQPCSNPSVHKCEVYHDSCMSTRTTLKFNGMRFTSVIKNCTASLLCHSNFICDKMNDQLAAVNMKTELCSVSCCRGDLCNGEKAEPDSTGFTTEGSITTQYPTDDLSPKAEPDPVKYTTDGPIPTEYPTDTSGNKALICYSCQDYPGSSQPCSNPSVTQCDNSQDSCMSAAITTGMFGTMTVKQCSTAKYECNSSTTCAVMNNTLAGSGLDMQECSLSCCQGNLCNGPSGGARFPTDRPNLTDHPTDGTAPKTLSCYSCQDYPGSSQPCSNPSVTQCDNSQDSCMSTVVTARMFGTSYTRMVKSCAISKYQCDSSTSCGIMNNALAGAGLDMQNCSLSCCQGNLCNGPSGGAEPDRSGFTTARPMSTDHPTDDPIPKPLICYSCQDYPGSSQPCSNPSVTQCDNSQDSCMSAVITTGMFGTMTVKKCSIAKYECNSSYTCAVMNNTLAGSGLDMQECSLSCCQGNLCNGPSGGGEANPPGFNTVTPMSTDHPTHDPTPKPLSCYFCQDYPGSSQPCSNPSVTQCNYSQDSCISTVVTARMFGTNYTRMEKNCAISKYECNSSTTCAVLNNTLTGSGLDLQECSLSCCQGSFCNGPSGGVYPTKDPSTKGCDAVFSKIITSPGYPSEYPVGFYSYFSVPIPHGMAMKITFNYFHMESDSSCRYDYLSIKNDNNTNFGKYCGFRSGHVVIVTGHTVYMSVQSDNTVTWRGYNLSFSAVPLGCLRPSTRQATTNQPTSQAVSSLSCYSCKDYPGGGSNQPCSNHSVTQCDNDQDSCMSFVVTADILGTGETKTLTVKHCAIFKYECNSSVACGALTNTLERGGLPDYDECSLSCCQGNLCNGPSGEAKPDPTRFTTERPTPTDHSTDYQVTEGCGEFSKNILTSPKYPQNYPPDMDCDYSVHIPHGMAMKITFNYFNLEDGGSSCKHDYLSIKNENNQTFGKYCDIQSGRIVVVTGDYVKITFHSDYSLSRKGFKLSFSPVPRVPGTLRPSTEQPTTQRPGCGAVSNNTLTSPGYPNNYPNNMYCAYMVDIPSGMAMEVTFNYFNVEGLFDCKRRRFDYLIIKNDDNQDFGEYCGYVYSGHKVTVTGRYVKIIFSSDGFVSKKGYNLSFSPIPLATYTTFALTRDSSTKSPRSTSAPTVTGPRRCPTAGQGSDFKGRLKCHVAHLQSLLNQVEDVVENDFGSISSINKRNQIERRVMKAIANLNAALKSAGRQKRDLSEIMIVHQLKKRAADLISRLRNKQGQYKRKTQLKPREKKREAKGRQLMKKAAETIAEKLFKMDKKKL